MGELSAALVGGAIGFLDHPKQGAHVKYILWHVRRPRKPEGMSSGWPWGDGETGVPPDEDDLSDERPTVDVNLDDLMYWLSTVSEIDQPEVGE